MRLKLYPQLARVRLILPPHPRHVGYRFQAGNPPAESLCYPQSYGRQSSWSPLPPMPWPVRLFQQARRRHAERRCDPLQDQNRRIAESALDAAHVSAVQAALEGQALLRMALRQAQSAQIGAQQPADVHARQHRRR